jgi:2-iminobutanoate/2-iminopropanoate deaminase
MKYPKAVWPYSPYYKAGNFIFCSGQIGLNPETMEIVKWWVEEETKQVISNISWVLEENWLSLKNIVKTTIFLKNINDFWKVNEIYWEYFSHKPARSTVEVANLPLWALVEIEVIAEK